MIRDEELRLECLKLALAAGLPEDEAVLERARSFAKFVLGEEGARDDQA